MRQLQALPPPLPRPAAPFSKGPPTPDPKRPGRKPGRAYGPKAHRAPPPRIDEVYAVPLPPRCPACGGTLVLIHQDRQYQVELPATPIYRCFEVAVGCCQACQQRVQGRHRLQTSDALGACASQLGAHTQAAIVHLNKDLGLSHGKIARLLSSVFGLELSRAGVCQAMQRVARRCGELDQALRQRLPQEAWAVVDDTAWKIGGRLGFLYVAVSPSVTVYRIEAGHSGELVQQLPGTDYPGVVIHDGAAVYDGFALAQHQTCLFHLLRRCRRLQAELSPGAAGFSAQVQALLQQALSLRDQRQRKERSVRSTRTWAGVLEGKLKSLLRRSWRHRENVRLAKHLRRHLAQVLLFLKRSGIDPTSYRAEQALRGAVVNRKVWGGSRTVAGARAQQVLMSVLHTARQRGRDTLSFLRELLCCPPGTPRPTLLPVPLAPPRPAPTPHLRE